MNFNEIAKLLNLPPQYYLLFTILALVLMLVVLLLKGLSLWRSARNGQKVWFWVLMFVNTMGVLEIIYLLTNKEGKTEKKEQEYIVQASKDEEENKEEPTISL